MNGIIGWQASPSSVTGPDDHCGSGSRTYSAEISTSSQASSNARASGWKPAYALRRSSTRPGVVHDSCRHASCATVAKTKMSRPRLSGKVTICVAASGPHHLVKAFRFGTPASFSAGTTARYATTPVKIGLS
ncbi:hypothetical protein D9M69_385830 [compost metagenome]